jgi:hypothetical protein
MAELCLAAVRTKSAIAVTLPALVTAQPLQNNYENTRISLSCCQLRKPNTLVYHTGYVTSNGRVTVNEKLKKMWKETHDLSQGTWVR